MRTLRVDILNFVPSKSPFKATFSKSFSEILDIFDEGIEVRQKVPSRRKDFPSMGFNALADHPITHSDSFRVIKAGILRRRGIFTCITPALLAQRYHFPEDMLLGHQRNRNRKWKNWTAILTTSQLLFFRGATVMTHIESSIVSGTSAAGIDLAVEPEDVVSLQNAFAVKEEGLNTVRFSLRYSNKAADSLISVCADRARFGSFLHQGINIFSKPIFPKTPTCG